MQKVSLALAVLGTTCALSAQAVTCGSQPVELRTYDPWQASFYYGNTTNISLGMFFDIDVQAPININHMATVTYDYGVGNPVLPDQSYNVAEVRIFMIPGSSLGNTQDPTLWGVSSPSSGLPEVFGELLIEPNWGDSTITNFKDANGNPVPFIIQPGQYGVCLQVIPTTYSGTLNLPQTNVPLLNPGSVHTLAVSPNPGTPYADQFISISNDAISQTSWYEVDALGNLNLYATPTAASAVGLNLAFNYLPPATTASSIQYGMGCYDKPRMIYEDFPEATDFTGDLENSAWTWFYNPPLSALSPPGGYYQIIAGGLPYDATAITTGTNIITTQTSTTGNWDDGSYIYTLPTSAFPSGFPFPGGTCTDITINSNGKIWFGQVTDTTWDTQGANYGSPAAFSGFISSITLPAALYAFECDLDPSTSGGVYLEDPSPMGGVRITYHAVPNWPAVAGEDCYVQVELLPSGQINVAYGSMLVNSAVGSGNNAFVGFSAGGGQPIATPIDWTSQGLWTSNEGEYAPTLEFDQRPIVGTTATIAVRNLMPGTAQPIGAFLFLGVAGIDPGFPLDFVGLTGCSAHIPLQYVLGNVLLTNTGIGEMTWAFNVPNLGATLPNYPQLFFQAATLQPNNFNGLGIMMTNGVCAQLGI